MKILYMSCHEILEYDELKLFSELGHECYSLGAYTQPGGEENRKRPALNLPYNPHFIELSLQYDRRKLHPEMLVGIDVVIIMHEIEFLEPRGDSGLGEGNWPLFREFIKNGGRVIWRSIGQSIPYLERRLKRFRDEGLEIVRYSPAEKTIADNAGCDAMIRFYKDPDEFNSWNGKKPRIINFTQSMKERREFCGYQAFQQVTTGFARRIYGPGNEDMGDVSGGLLSYTAQKQALRDNRVYFYSGTYPASYTLSFMEAMMTGIPMVCVGKQLGNGQMFPGQETYEIPSMIEHGVSGFVSDDIAELRSVIKQLIDQPALARQISVAGRERAIELFGRAKVKDKWRTYLEQRPTAPQN